VKQTKAEINLCVLWQVPTDI